MNTKCIEAITPNRTTTEITHINISADIIPNIFMQHELLDGWVAEWMRNNLA